MDCSYYPEEWSDDERINVLMGPMPAETASAAYNGRVVFWTTAIQQWLTTMKKVSFTIKDILNAFRRGTKQPLCIQEVIDNLAREQQVMKADDFWALTPRTRQQWWGWAYLLRAPPLLPSRDTWFFASNIQSTRTLNSTYIHMKNVQVAGEDICKSYWLAKAKNEIKSVTSIEKLYPFVSDVLAVPTDLHLVIHHMYVCGKVGLRYELGEPLIKFIVPGQTTAPQITDSEVSKLRLTDVHQDLSEKILSSRTNIAEMRLEAKKLLGLNLRTSALRVLKSKKESESNLDGLMSIRDNVAITLEKLEASELNREVLLAFQGGLKALEQCVASSGGIQSANEIMDDLQDMYRESNEVGRTMATPSLTEYTDEDLEKELDDLIAQQECELPDIPDNDPLVALKNMKISEPLLSP